MKLITRFLATAALLAAAAGPARAANLYVSPAGGGDGTIGNPTDLQSALDLAAASAEDDTLFLLQGTYPAAATFTYAASNAGALRVDGGWAPDFAYRSLSPSQTVLDGQDARRVLRIAVTGSGGEVQVAVENLTVQNGYTTYAAAPGDTGNGAGIKATNEGGVRLFFTMRWVDVLDNVNGQYSSEGGGLYADCWLGLYHCNFRRNSTHYIGGGISMRYAEPWDSSIGSHIEDCVFEANEAVDGVYLGFGGSHVFAFVAPYFKRTAFIGKAGGASSGGSGVVAAYGAYPTFENCAFAGNVSQYWGGAVQLWDAGGQFRGCLFVNNTSGASGDGAGGGIAVYDPSGDSPRIVTVVNCTFVGNLTGGYQGNGGAIHNRVSAMIVANSVFWGNGTAANKGSTYALADETGAATISYSTVQGGLSGTGFIGSNFMTQAPYTGEPWEYPYTLLGDSPCIDAGSNAAVASDFMEDFQGEPRVFGFLDRGTHVVDMGWDEYYDGDLNITWPGKHDVWLNDGKAKTITWTCANIPGNVRLSLWRDSPAEGGTELRQIAAAVPCSAGSRSWTMPIAYADRDDYAVVIESIDLPAAREWSSFVTQHLMLAKPNRGNLTQGSTYAITWKSGGLTGALVKIELYNGGKRKLLVSPGAPNTGSFSWKVPLSLAATKGYQLKLSTTSPRVAEDWSDGYLAVLPAVKVTAPNGGEVWARGTTHTISWTYRNSPGTAVRLELYKGAALDRTIAASVPIGTAGAGSYRWKIPAALAASTDYRVKVTSTAWPKVLDWSDNGFVITE